MPTQKRARRVEVECMNTKTLNHLPVELLSDILSRLPLTSLLQPKFTCKFWLTIIDDPTLPNMHLKHALKHPGYLYSLMNVSDLYFADKPLDLAVGMTLPLELLPELYNEDFASSGGLLCYRFSAKEPFYICNPVMRGEKHVQIPESSTGAEELAWGFGYAPMSKKYKLIQYSCQPRRFKPEIAIYTLGEETWRELPRFPLLPSGSHVYCNGAIYWTTADVHGEKFESGKHVVSFDLDTETCRPRQPLPSDYDVHRQCLGIYLAALGETIAFVTYSRGNYYQVWMLVDEAHDVWVHNYNFVFPSIPRERGLFRLFGIWMNNQLYGVHKVKATDTSQRWRWAVKQYVYDTDCKSFANIQLPLPRMQG